MYLYTNVKNKQTPKPCMPDDYFVKFHTVKIIS